MIEYKNVSLANQVYDELELKILSGALPKGKVLTEKKLSAEMGVSRTPIREALSRLVFERLIKETPTGNVVLGISDKDVDDAFEVKRRIEVLATRRACENITEKGLEELKDIVDQQEFYARKEDAYKVRDLDTEFHDVIYKECGSSVMEGILSPLHHKLMKFRRASLELEHRIMDSVAEHKAIYEAIKEGDGDKVDTLILIHLEHAYNSIVEVTRREESTEVK